MMHFFLPIQQSALHVYHSALPLCPRLSTLHLSLNLHYKTRIKDFYGRSDAWGIVVRTISPSSKSFTCATTFGHRIAAACDGGAVDIYDSVTGVLSLSLSPEDRVQEIRGSPDGSILFCAHQVPSITVWDMQTGGLIHTFVLERHVEDIAVSLKGRYLACGSSGGSVEVWEVANAMEGAVVWTSSPVNSFSWLAPEECLAVSTGALVRVWDIVAGTVLHDFTIQYPVHRMVYSRKFDWLAIMASPAPRSAMTILNPQTGTSTIPHWIHQRFSCFAFSQTTEELVCGMETHGLQLFNVSTQCWKYIGYPDTITSVSFLPNRTVVAGFAGSGIQLLNLDGGDATFQHPNIPALNVHTFDQGRIVAALLTSSDRIVLLEPGTMSQLFTIPVENTHTISTDHAAILCASLDHGMAVYYFSEGEKEYMQMWEFHDERPKWTVEIGGLPSIGGISPSGARLVTFYDVNNQTCVCMWDVQNGLLKAQLRVDPIHPLEIIFDSETRFHSYHDTYRIPYVVAPSLINRTFNVASWARFGHSIVCCEPLPLTGGSQERYYHVDGTYEWVVSRSKKICWIPPGYIGSVRSGYCWAGSSLFMAGQDGKLRKFTFG